MRDVRSIRSIDAGKVRNSGFERLISKSRVEWWTETCPRLVKISVVGEIR